MPRREILATATALRAAFGSATFTTGSAEAAGVPRHRLFSAARAGVVVRLRQGTYRLPGGDLGHPGGSGQDARESRGSTHSRDYPLSTEDALRVRDRLESFARADIQADIGERTGARMWGVDLWNVPVESSPILIVPRGHARRGLSGGVTIIERNVDPRHRASSDGPHPLPVLDPLLCALQVASRNRLSMEARIAVINAGMRRQLAYEEQARGIQSASALSARLGDPRLRDALLQDAHQAAATLDTRARHVLLAAVALADPRLETVLESISWHAFHAAGIDLPTPQAVIFGASGRRWRVDFDFGDRVIGECDGAVKYSDASAIWREKKRQEDLEQAGYIVVRWTWEEIMYRPEAVIERIRRALARAALLRHSA